MHKKTKRFVLDEFGNLFEETVDQFPLEGSFRRAILLDEVKTMLVLSPVIDILKTNNVVTGNLHLILNGSGVVSHSAVRLEALNFHANWEVKQAEGRTFLQPVMTESSIDSNSINSALNPIYVDKNLLWVIPKELPTYLIMDNQTLELYLITFDSTVNFDMRMLPVPNYFRETRLCYKVENTIKESLKKASILERIRTVYDSWVHSLWNRDLYNSDFPLAFRWEDDGRQQMYPIHQYLKPVKDVDYPPEIDSVYKLLKETEMKLGNNAQ